MQHNLYLNILKVQTYLSSQLLVLSFQINFYKKDITFSLVKFDEVEEDLLSYLVSYYL